MYVAGPIEMSDGGVTGGRVRIIEVGDGEDAGREGLERRLNPFT